MGGADCLYKSALNAISSELFNCKAALLTCVSCSLGETVGKWELSSEVKSSISAISKISQTIWTVWGRRLHSPGNTLDQYRMFAPWFRLPCTCTTLKESRLHWAHWMRHFFKKRPNPGDLWKPPLSCCLNGSLIGLDGSSVDCEQIL